MYTWRLQSIVSLGGRHGLLASDDGLLGNLGSGGLGGGLVATQAGTGRNLREVKGGGGGDLGLDGRLERVILDAAVEAVALDAAIEGVGLEGLLSGRGRELRLDGESRLIDSGNGLLGLFDLLAGGGLAVEKILDLVGVVTSVLLADGRNLLHLLRSDISNLSGLRVDQLRSMVNLLVDELLVRGVDQGNQESNSGSNDGKTPVRNKLDQVVRDEGSDEGL